MNLQRKQRTNARGPSNKDGDMDGGGVLRAANNPLVDNGVVDGDAGYGLSIDNSSPS